MSAFIPLPTNAPSTHEIAVRQAYEIAGRAYDAYADGDTSDLLALDGPHAEADRQVWRRIDDFLTTSRAAGKRELRVLDVGCGPGTWLARVVARAADLRFEAVVVVGLDLSPAMAETARRRLEGAAYYHGTPSTRVVVRIEQGDAAEILPRMRRGFDLVLCLYSVMNHLGAEARAVVARELCRSARGRLLVSVRAAGSTPTIYIDRLDHARDFRQDERADQLDVDLLDGTHLVIPSHLFRASELDGLFAPYATERSIRGLDLFHGRFAADPRWTAAGIDRDERFRQRLDELELACANDAALIDHATHLLLEATGAGMLRHEQ